MKNNEKWDKTEVFRRDRDPTRWGRKESHHTCCYAAAIMILHQDDREGKNMYTMSINYHRRELPQVSFLSRQTRVCPATKLCIYVQKLSLSRQFFFCCAKTFVATKDVVVATKLILWQLPPIIINHSFWRARKAESIDICEGQNL